MSFSIFQFFFPDPALFYSSWPLRENSTTELLPVLDCLHSDLGKANTASLTELFTPARLTITAPGARQFLRGKLKLMR